MAREEDTMFKYALLCVMALAVIGCSSDGDKASTTATTTTTTGTADATTGTTATTGTAANTTTSGSEDTAMVGGGTATDYSSENAAPPKPGQEVAVMETNLGRIVIKFLPEKAPLTVANFKKLAAKGYYDGIKFHRVIPDFMIQGGDPNSKDDNRLDDGSGGPGYNINDEFSDVHHGPGVVSMANTGQPNSAGSQFFIMVSDKAFLDGKYSAFGQVVQGMDVAHKIVGLKRDERDNPLPENPAIIKSVKIAKWPLKG
jgi:peptidyl-prolyl cis-trans isomerase B (cyclophilin B)